MAKFFKYFLATFLGGLASALVLFIILLAFLTAIIATGNQKDTIAENTILYLKLDGEIKERVDENPLAEFFAEMNDASIPQGLNTILKNIKKAKSDHNISGIIMEPSMINAGYATIEEIRNALIDFKSSGKFIYSYNPVYSQKAYYLASVSDKVYLTPGGMLEFKGLYAQRTFFKNTLSKLGVEMQIFKHGKFKSAVEPFINEKMSEPARLQTEVYLNSIWDHVAEGVAESRGLTIPKVNDIASQMPLFMEDEALLQTNLIDGLKYKDEFIAELKTLTNTDEEDDLETVSSLTYANIEVPKVNKKSLSKNKIAVVYASGDIDGSDSEGIKSDKFSKELRKVRRDSTIKAVVLRINSPGGSALGSEIIWREIKLLKEAKPLIVSMGDLAASGGYYIACEADYIMAHPTTLTGSIGIFGMIPNTKELTKKLGFSFDGVKTNKYADMPSIVRPFREDEKALLQAMIEKGYDTFITRCADGRNTTKEAIDEIGQGRVWSGTNALDNRLIDEIGGIARAIDIAKERAELEDFRIVEFPEEEDPFKEFMKGISSDVRMYIGESILGDDYQLLHTLQSLKTNTQLQTRIPYDLSIQ